MIKNSTLAFLLALCACPSFAALEKKEKEHKTWGNYVPGQSYYAKSQQQLFSARLKSIISWRSVAIMGGITAISLIPAGIAGFCAAAHHRDWDYLPYYSKMGVTFGAGVGCGTAIAYPFVIVKVIKDNTRSFNALSSAIRENARGDKADQLNKTITLKLDPKLEELDANKIYFNVLDEHGKITGQQWLYLHAQNIRNDWTPLHYAIFHENLPLIQLLARNQSAFWGIPKLDEFLDSVACDPSKRAEIKEILASEEMRSRGSSLFGVILQPQDITYRR